MYYTYMYVHKPSAWEYTLLQVQWDLYITDTLGRIILSIIERLSSFRGKNVLPLYRLVYWPLYRGVLYQRFHCMCV